MNCCSYRGSNFMFLCIAGKPLILIDPEDVTVKAGEQAEFSCSYDVANQPLPKFTKWRITDSNGNVRIADETGSVGANPSTYTISSTDRSDAGKYECVVENEFGNDTSSSATLTVQCKYAFFYLFHTLF